jgi:dephospho-CoA kinase
VRVAVTGGIGSGKSTVARMLRDRGAQVIDADVLAREAVEPGSPGLDAVVLAFGPEVLGPGGGLDRARMAGIVFTDPLARRRLEQIVHPIVHARSQQIEASLPPGSVVVHDIPLLAESGRAGEFDLVVVVDAVEAARLDRLVQRGMSAADAAARMAAQADRDAMLAIGDVVITNDGTTDDLAVPVQLLWARILDAGRDLQPRSGSPEDAAPQR